MNFKEITQLIDKAEKSSLTYIEIKDKDFKIVLKKEKETVMINSPQIIEPINVNKQIQDNPQVTEQEDNKSKDNIKTIKAPMVGTFYSSPSPDAESFVKVGDKVKVGDTVCILEAMKLMNEIESEFEGTITKILVENEQMVEYGQPLFEVEVK